MPTIAEVRQKFPQYNDMSDTDLAGALHKKFYSDMPVEEFNQKIGLSAAPPSDAAAAITIRPVDDHGLAERQKLSPLEKAVSPITSYPETYGKMNLEARQQMERGAGQLAEGWGAAQPGSLAGLGQFAKGAANVGLGALGYLASPVNAAYRSVIGQPVEDVTGIPREYTEFAAQLATPGIGLTGKVPEAMPPERALMSEVSPEARPPPPAAPGISPGMAAAQAAQRQEIAVPRVLTSDNRVTQQAGQFLSKQPMMGGGQIARAVENVPAQLAEARNAVADQFGGARTSGNVASDIRQQIGGAAETETQAAQEAARQADEAARAQWEQTNQAREQAIGGYEAQSAREAGQQVGDAAPTDMGQSIVDTVRANHEVARNAKDAAYRDAGSREGTVFDDAVGSADRHVNMDLRSDVGGQGIVTTTPTLTPAAMEMRQSLRNFSERGRQRALAAQAEAIDGGGTAADAAQTGINLRTLETQRQELGNMAQGAANDADRRAARRIMGAFDDWQQRAMENHFDGDPEALSAYLRARALNRDYRERFGYNEGNDADKTINKIVRGDPGEHIGPNDVANVLTGAPDKAGRLLDRVYAATGDHPNHPNVVQAVRGGFWNKLSGTVEGATPRTSEKIASDIYKFTRGPNRDVAGRIFTPQDQALMERHADVLRAAVRAREQTAALAKANEPKPTEVTKGPMQELANRVLGRGQKSDEALYNTIEGYAKSKSRQDLNTLAGVMRNLPDELRGNFLNTFIRRLGTGQKDAFSPAIFEKEWRNLTPQTKAVLTGNAGPHVAALDDIAAISKHFDEVHRRFGNPSGSGQSINFAQLGTMAAAALAGTLANPLKTAALYFGGGYGVSKFLSTPQGAASLAKFSDRMRRLQEVPTIENAAAVRLSARNMRNTALALGIHAKIPDGK